MGGKKGLNNTSETKEKRVFLGAIMGGFATPRNAANGTARRKIAQLMAVHAAMTVPKTGRNRPILGFSDEEKVNGGSNEIFPLVIIVEIHEHDVNRCLIDEGGSVDILYQDAFEKLGLWKTNSNPYEGTELQGFNMTRTRPWGYINLDVTFGERTIETTFLVVPVISVYNCILRRTLTALDVITSTVHLKMKYNGDNGKVVTIHTNLRSANRC